MSDPQLTIEDVRARAVVAPMKRPVRTAVGDVPAAPLVLIDVMTAEGVTGRSYIFGYTPLTLSPLVEIIAKLRELVKGKPVVPVARQRDFENTFRLLGRQGLLGMAISGLDMAFWDILGRAEDRPVVHLLGGEAVPIPAYDSYGMIDLAKDADAIGESVEQGFEAIKIKVGGGELQRDVETVAAVRDLIGPDVRLMVDYNQSLDVPEARRRIAALAKFDLQWVEEPVPAEDLASHAEIRATSPVPIQTGENWWFPEDAARAIAAKASDCAMLDIMKIGGVTGWLRAAAMAEGASLPVSSHLFVEASAHVLPVTATAHWHEWLDIASAVMAEPLGVQGGKVMARGPGLGMDWDEKAVTKYAE
jgi:mandelate racemase